MKTIHSKSIIAFTLVELLVVISIIAILGALLLPALSQTRLTSKRLVCLSNQRNVHIALWNLASENEGWINGINSQSSPSGPISWTQLIAPYLSGGATNSAGVAIMLARGETACPGIRPYHYENGAWGDGGNPFGVNTQFCGVPGMPNPMHKLTEVRHSSRIYLVSDCYYQYPDGGWLPHHSGFTMDGAWWPGYHFHARHPVRANATPGVYTIGNGLNFVFVDGHGEFLKRWGVKNSWDCDWWYSNGQASEWGSPYGISGE